MFGNAGMVWGGMNHGMTIWAGRMGIVLSGWWIVAVVLFFILILLVVLPRINIHDKTREAREFTAILNRRYAAGEITRRQYLQFKEDFKTQHA
jgi:uncharacterized membrane protein